MPAEHLNSQFRLWLYMYKKKIKVVMANTRYCRSPRGAVPGLRPGPIGRPCLRPPPRADGTGGGNIIHGYMRTPRGITSSNRMD